MKRIDVGAIKTQHKQQIIREILKNELRSRNGLAAELGLSVVTVANILQELGNAGFFCEVRDESSTVGRKPNLIQLLPASSLFLTFDLSTYYFSAHILDLSLGVTHTFVYPNSAEANYRDSLTRFVDEVCASIRNAGLTGNVAGVGVCVPGSYDAEKDRVLCDKIPDLFTLRIGELFRGYFDCTVHFEHDVRLMFVNDLQSIEDYREKSIFYLYVGDGISGVISINGSIYGGAIDIAGEVGRITVDGGKTLNEVMLWEALVQHLKPDYPDVEHLQPYEISSMLHEWHDDSGTGFAREIDAIVDALCSAFLNIIYFLNPHEIMINSRLRVLGERFMERLREQLSRTVQPFVLDNMRIMFTPSEEHGHVLGLGILLREHWIREISHKEYTPLEV